MPKRDIKSYKEYLNKCADQCGSRSTKVWDQAYYSEGSVLLKWISVDCSATVIGSYPSILRWFSSTPLGRVAHILYSLLWWNTLLSYASSWLVCLTQCVASSCVHKKSFLLQLPSACLFKILPFTRSTQLPIGSNTPLRGLQMRRRSVPTSERKVGRPSASWMAIQFSMPSMDSNSSSRTPSSPSTTFLKWYFYFFNPFISLKYEPL